MELTGIDHFVLTVEDVATSCSFYDSLGGDVVTFGGGRKAVQFGDQKINLHPVDNDVDVVAASPTSGGGDFCLVTETPIGDVERRLRELDVEIVRGPVERTGAAGPITSVYVRDPDDNLVEIGSYADA
ncbi:Catechol 2,3-dioxygenase [Halopelagius inordinatus]|uniref:Catechol 2,3-dioxygenase n=1 Tax=Halopelagius inordinatus TaxID=553467 RepID=A0A1I2LCF9_9EURY|nr:VOC family protein [Halopelagius inordinatus]SFF75167.1 Catechol 2,3-dioxygenase [Halopelagius inordinatus]